LRVIYKCVIYASYAYEFIFYIFTPLYFISLPQSRFYSAQQQSAAAPKQQAPAQPPKPAAQEAPKSGGFGFFTLLTGILAGTAAATYFDLKPYVKDLEKQYGITILPPATATAAPTKQTTTTASSAELAALQKQIASATNHLAAEKESTKQLQAQVASLEAERAAIKDSYAKQVAELKDQLSRITVSTAAPSTTSSSDAAAPVEVKTVTIVQDNPADKQEIARLTAELVKVQLDALQAIETISNDLLDTQRKLHAAVESHKKDAAALAQATSEFQVCFKAVVNQNIFVFLTKLLKNIYSYVFFLKDSLGRRKEKGRRNFQAIVGRPSSQDVHPVQ